MSRKIISSYRFSLQTGEMKEPFYGPYGNDVIADFGLSVPCSADEFHARWSATSMKPYPEQRERFLKAVSVEALRAVLRKKPRTGMKYSICDLKGNIRHIETQIELSLDSEEPFAVMTNYKALED